MYYLHARQNILELMIYKRERCYRNILQNRICTEPTKRLHEVCQQMKVLICDCECMHHAPRYRNIMHLCQGKYFFQHLKSKVSRYFIIIRSFINLTENLKKNR